MAPLRPGSLSSVVISVPSVLCTCIRADKDCDELTVGSGPSPDVSDQEFRVGTGFARSSGSTALRAAQLGVPSPQAVFFQSCPPRHSDDHFSSAAQIL